MDLERLGLTRDQQSQIDEQFLEMALAALRQKSNYAEMAWLTDGPLGAELETIFIRTLDEAHEAIIANREVAPATLRCLGKLSFIDALQLPSSDTLPKRDKAPNENRGREGWWENRRLFVGAPNGDRQ